MEVMFIKNNNNNLFNKNLITTIYSEEDDLSIILSDLEYIKYKPNMCVRLFIKNDKTLLKDLKIDNSILNKRLKELSYSEFKLIFLIKAILLKPDLIILNNFEKGFVPRDYNYLWRFIKNVTLSYGIKFVIVSKDLKFINKITNNIIIIKNKVIKYEGDIITAIKQNLIIEPEIIKFIKLANQKDANLTYTLDRKELLKDIYRSLT